MAKQTYQYHTYGRIIKANLSWSRTRTKFC